MRQRRLVFFGHSDLSLRTVGGVRSAESMIATMHAMYLELRTDDPGLVALCEAYWGRDEEGTLTRKVADLAAAHGLTAGMVRRTVNEVSVARLADERCVGCGEGRTI